MLEAGPMIYIYIRSEYQDYKNKVFCIFDKLLEHQITQIV